MRLNMYSVIDTATAAYMRPFFMQSDVQAIRTFKDIAIDAEHEIGKHPEDYALVRIGIFDDQNGTLTDENNQTLITGLEAVALSRQTQAQKLNATNKLQKETQQ